MRSAGRWLVMLGLVGGLAPIAAAHPYTLAVPELRQRLTGEVIAVNRNGGGLVVREQLAPGAQSQSFVVERATMIAENGRPIGLDEQLIGKPVRIEYTIEDGQHRAHSIIVTDLPTRG